MKLAIYKSRSMGTADVVGNVVVDKEGVKITSDTKELLKIIRISLKSPAKVKSIRGRTATKRKPKDVAEHVANSLRLRVSRPYWIGPKFFELEDPKYSETIGKAGLEHVVNPIEVG